MSPRQAGADHLEAIGRRLRALREHAELDGKDLASQLGWSASKVSRLELARQGIAPADIAAWITATDGTPDERALLLGLLDQAREEEHTLRRRARHGQAAIQAGYNTLVERSSLVRLFQTAVVPGLLQTPDYARAILTAAQHQLQLSVEDIDAAVSTRMERQRYLYSGRRFELLIAEPVLRWGIVPPEVMCEQIDRLHGAIGLGNVRLGILPLGAPLDLVPLHTFAMYDDLVCVETFGREHRYTGSEAETYANAFDTLWRSAVTGHDARRLLVQVADELVPSRTRASLRS
ncbi:Transcriptional regulator, contains XRE-family HTH domain [Promicromonospora umidemergens]|uniref:Helix-turn-helix transcriptional regulator n=1 Tax=Promicromonospora umidemergens TaxID=629679 RepID=A0ABP8WTV5_9MICO|nr:helix-turn-helix transcriptional regulator [Promicromonospora umidemergens]MCP2283637.1 Transcriptional regulator, contains XRE-family HTH domain [Promicromonospora umidemergens]